MQLKLENNLKKPMKNNPLSISVCMIVKNEEENLAQCLLAIQNHVDEIIVVDTGSSDDTVNIAKKFGARVYHFLWNDDFSAARNFAIQQASKEWVFNLDADHIFGFEPGFSLRRFIRESGHHGLMIDERSYFSSTEYERLDRLLLFENHHGFKYEGIIHEHPLKSIKEYASRKNTPGPFESIRGCWLNHAGHMDVQKKLPRNLSLLQVATKKEPHNFHYKFKFLLTLKGLQDPQFAGELLNTVYNVEKSNPPLTEAIVGIWGMFGEWVILGQNAESLERFYEGARVINEKTKWNDIRLVWPYVKISIIQKKYGKAINDLKKCIQQGIAPSHVAIRAEERISPVFQLLKLINSHRPALDFVQQIEKLPDLLSKTALDIETVLHFIGLHDKGLFDSIYHLLNEKQKENITALKKHKKNNLAISENRPFISLCMIVKNEETNLKRCLNSVKNIVDEIIIVDTGSDDKTIEVAKTFNAKVLEYEWNDSFSDARNLALGHATGKWILHLDADEELHRSSIDRLKEKLKASAADGINVIIRNHQPQEDLVSFLDENQVRLFLNKKNYRYRNKVHEQIIPSIAGNSGKFEESDIIVNHYGYQANNEQRAQRNFNLLKEELQESPQDAYLLFKMGETYKALKQWDKAAEFLTKALSNPQGSITNEIKEVIYLRLGQIALAKDNQKEAQEYVLACLRFNGKNAMAKYILALTMMYSNETEKGMKLFLELKATQQIHGLDLSEIDILLEVFNNVQPTEKVLN